MGKTDMNAILEGLNDFYDEKVILTKEDMEELEEEYQSHLEIEEAQRIYEERKRGYIRGFEDNSFIKALVHYEPKEGEIANPIVNPLYSLAMDISDKIKKNPNIEFQDIIDEEEFIIAHKFSGVAEQGVAYYQFYGGIRDFFEKRKEKEKENIEENKIKFSDELLEIIDSVNGELRDNFQRIVRLIWTKIDLKKEGFISLDNRINLIKEIAKGFRRGESRKIYELSNYFTDNHKTNLRYINKLRENPTAPVEAIHELVTFKHEDYELIKYLDSGGFKDVYLGKISGLDDEVVIKFFKEEEAKRKIKRMNAINGDFSFQLFEKKIMLIAQRANNVNIAKIISIPIKLSDDTYFSVEEKFKTTLEKLVNEKKKLNIYDTLEITCQIINGLEGLHSQGVPHGDINPSNIGLNIDDEEIIVKLTDAGSIPTYSVNGDFFIFQGLSRRAPELYPSEVSTKFKNVVFYQGIDRTKSDIFSLGVIIYYMLTGEYPFYIPNSLDKEKNYSECEIKVYSDIISKLKDPEKKLFNRKEFENCKGRIEYDRGFALVDINKYYESKLGSLPNFEIDIDSSLRSALNWTMRNCLEFDQTNRPNIDELMGIKEIFNLYKKAVKLGTPKMI